MVWAGKGGLEGQARVARNGTREDIWRKELDEGPETRELGKEDSCSIPVEKVPGGQVQERRNAADRLSVI